MAGNLTRLAQLHVAKSKASRTTTLGNVEEEPTGPNLDPYKPVAPLEDFVSEGYDPDRTRHDNKFKIDGSLIGGEGSTRLGSTVGSFIKQAGVGIASIPEAFEQYGVGAYNALTDSSVDSEELYTPLDTIADLIKGSSSALGSPNPETADGIPEIIGGGLGSIASFIGPGAVVKAMGAGAKLSRGAQIFTGTAQVGMENVRDYEASQASKGLSADPTERFTTFLYGSGIGLTEALPITRALNRLEKAGQGKLRNSLMEIAKGGTEEFIQEGLQQTLSNFVASDLVAYDKDRGLFEDTAKSAAFGGGVGLIFNALVVAAGGRRRAQQIANQAGVRDRGTLERAAADPANQLKSSAASIKETQLKQADINPTTGDPLTSAKVKRINLALQRSLDMKAGAEEGSSVANEADIAIARYEKALKIIIEKEGGDVLEQQEARDTLSRTPKAPIPESTEQAAEELSLVDEDEVQSELPLDGGEVITNTSPVLESADLDARNAELEAADEAFNIEQEANISEEDIQDLWDKVIQSDDPQARDLFKANFPEAYVRLSGEMAEEALSATEDQEELDLDNLPEMLKEQAGYAPEDTPTSGAVTEEQAGIMPEEGNGVGTPLSPEEAATIDPALTNRIIPASSRTAPKAPLVQEGDVVADQVVETDEVSEAEKQEITDTNVDVDTLDADAQAIVDKINSKVANEEEATIEETVEPTPATEPEVVQEEGEVQNVSIPELDAYKADLEAEVAALRAKTKLTAKDKRSFAYVTGVAESSDRMSAKNRALFHAYNPYGLRAEMDAIDKEVSLAVEEGRANSGSLLAHGSLNTFADDDLRALTAKKRPSPADVISTLGSIQRHLDGARKFLEGLDSSSPAVVKTQIATKQDEYLKINKEATLDSGTTGTVNEEAVITTKNEELLDKEEKGTLNDTDRATVEWAVNTAVDPDTVPTEHQIAFHLLNTRGDIYKLNEAVNIKVQKALAEGISPALVQKLQGVDIEVLLKAAAKRRGTEQEINTVLAVAEGELQKRIDGIDVLLKLEEAPTVTPVEGKPKRKAPKTPKKQARAKAANTQATIDVLTDNAAKADEKVSELEIKFEEIAAEDKSTHKIEVQLRAAQKRLTEANRALNKAIGKKSADTNLLSDEEIKQVFQDERDGLLDDPDFELKQNGPVQRAAIRSGYAADYMKNMGITPTLPVDTKILKDPISGAYVYQHTPTTNVAFSNIVAKFNESAKRIGREIEYVSSPEGLDLIPMRALQSSLSGSNKATPYVVGGFVERTTGKIYVIGSAAANKEELVVTLVHELVGHAGMRNMFDTLSGTENGYSNFLHKEARKDTELFRQAVNLIYGKGYRHLFSDTTIPGGLKVNVSGVTKWVSEGNSVRIFDEYIAHTTNELIYNPKFQEQHGGFFKRLMAIVKHALRKLGIQSNDMTRQDVLDLIAESNNRLFSKTTDSATQFMMGGRGPKYQIARYTDIKSESFRPEIAAVMGEAPEGSWLEEQVKTDQWEDALPDLQIKTLDEIDKSEESHVLQVARIIQQGENGVSSIRRNSLETAINSLWDRVKESKFIKSFTKHGALGNIKDKNIYRHISQLTLGDIGKAENFAKTLQASMSKFNAEQNIATTEFFTTRDAKASDIPNIPDSTRQQLEVAKLQLMEFGDKLVELGKLSPKKHASTRGMYLPKVYFKYLNEYANSTTGKRISFMGYLQKQKTLSEEESAELGKVVDPNFIIPDTIGTIGRDIALLNMTKNLIDVSSSLKLGYVLGESHKVGYKSGPKGARKTTEMTIYQVEDELERLTAQMEDGVHGPMHNYNDAQLAHVSDQIKYTQDVLKIADNLIESEVKELLISQGHAPEAITQEMINEYKTANYQQMPIDKAYGFLSGKWVMKGIRNDFVETVRASNAVLSTMEDGIMHKAEVAHQWWKMGKVVLNVPVSTIRNSAGNMMLLDFGSDQSIAALSKQVYEEVRGAVYESQGWEGGSKSRFWKIGEDYGLIGTTFAANELNLVKRNRTKDIKDLKRTHDLSQLRGNLGLSVHNVGNKLMNGINELVDFYGNQEAAFKVVKLREYIETWESQQGRGIDSLSAAERDAVITRGVVEANDAIFNYGEVAPFVRWARRAPFLGSPFLTFTYKSMLKVPENFVKHPQKFIKYAVMSSTLASSVMGNFLSADWDDDEADEALATLAEYYDNNQSIFLIPWKSDNGNYQIVDLTPFVPYASHLNMLAAVEAGLTQNDSSEGALKALNSIREWSGFGSAPIPNIMSSLMLNKDSFTKREIATEGAPGSEQLEQYMRYVVSQILPPILTERGAVGHALDNVGLKVPGFSTGRQKDRFGDDREGAWQNIARFAGTNAVDINAEKGRANLTAAMQREERAIKIHMNRIKKNNNLSPEQKAIQLRASNERLKRMRTKFNNRFNKDQ